MTHLGKDYQSTITFLEALVTFASYTEKRGIAGRNQRR